MAESPLKHLILVYFLHIGLERQETYGNACQHLLVHRVEDRVAACELKAQPFIEFCQY